MHEATKYEADEKLCNLTDFCNFALNDVFGGSQKEPEIQLSILTANIDFSEYLYHILKSLKCKRNLLFCYNGVADIYMAFRGNDNIELTLELYKKSLTIIEHLDAEFSSPESGIYEELGGSDNLKL